MESRTGNGHSAELERFYHDLRKVVEDGEQLLKAGLHSVREQTRAAADRTHYAVLERPYQSIGIAFGVGLAVGLLAAGMVASAASNPEAQGD
jgi:ElaB/YqjD/DUF883 family membrane-anchored ribosome-binding protein